MTLTPDGLADPAHIYAHPGYWAGHTKGDGDAVIMKETEPSIGQIIKADEALAAYKRKPSAGMVLDSYIPGDAFLAESHAPGTILSIDVEYLYTSHGTEVDPADYEGVDPPIRQRMIWPASHSTNVRSSLLWYIHHASGSVVLEGRRQALRTIVGAHLGYSILPNVFPATQGHPGYIFHPSEFVVGEVRHTHLSKTSLPKRMRTPLFPVKPTDKPYRDVLSRINRVDILAPGATQNKRKFVLLPGMRPKSHGAAA